MTINAGLTLDDAPAWLADLVRSGIRTPEVRKLPPGMKVYRFANSKNDRGTWAGGPWWFDRRALNLIVQDSIANAPGFGMGWSGRRALAIRQEWSTVDILVEASIQEEIYVFTGKGTKQYREMAPNGMYITWEGWPHVDQLFLPYINDRQGHLTAAGQRALLVYRTVPIESYQMF